LPSCARCSYWQVPWCLTRQVVHSGSQHDVAQFCLVQLICQPNYWFIFGLQKISRNEMGLDKGTLMNNDPNCSLNSWTQTGEDMDVDA
jgi:hypothetical protein